MSILFRFDFLVRICYNSCCNKSTKFIIYSIFALFQISGKSLHDTFFAPDFFAPANNEWLSIITYIYIYYIKEVSYG